MSSTLVLGVGNILWADEGFGVRAAEAFAAAWDTGPSVTVMDGGTQGLLLIPHLQAHQNLILLDAVDFGAAPGSLVEVRDRDLPAFFTAKKMSLHQTGMQEVLALADLLGAYPKQALLLGVQPVDMEDYGGSLSAPVRARVPEAVAKTAAQLQAWGERLAPRSGPAPALFDVSLALTPYEAGRPDAHAACRYGDERVLARAGG